MWAGFQFFNAYGHEAQDVFVQTHVTFHFCYGIGWRIKIQKDIVALLVFANAIGEGAKAPLLGLSDLAAKLVTISENEVVKASTCDAGIS